MTERYAQHYNAWGDPTVISWVDAGQQAHDHGQGQPSGPIHVHRPVVDNERQGSLYMNIYAFPKKEKNEQ